jgi:hypothetical protein
MYKLKEMKFDEVFGFDNEIIRNAVIDEFGKVIGNIGNKMTKPTAKRTITLKYVITPSADRQSVDVDIECSSKLAQKTFVQIQMDVNKDANGKVTMKEHKNVAPGQLSIDGEEEPQPKKAEINLRPVQKSDSLI